MPEIKYDKLCEQLERMIRGGTFGKKLPGIHKLARQLGANHITVRKALELLIDRGLLEVIPSRGTFVREQEKTVRNFHVIGCVGANCSSHIREMVFNRMNDRLAETGYKILDITASSTIFKENPRLLLQFPVDGYIFFGSSMSRKIMKLLLEKRIPVISMYNRNFPEINHVGMDYFSSYSEALKTLKQCGCRRIAFLDYQRYGDFQSYTEDIRSVFISGLGSAFEPRLFSVYDSADYYLRHGEDYHRIIAEECVHSWEKPFPDGLITVPEVIAAVKQLMPSIKTLAFTRYGYRCDSDIVMCEDLPGLLKAASGRMLELLAGDSTLAEIRIPCIRKISPGTDKANRQKPERYSRSRLKKITEKGQKE